jgi:F-type H+-transporting ATPase subunit b
MKDLMMLSFTRKCEWFAVVALCGSMLMARTVAAQHVDEAGQTAAEKAAVEAEESEASGDPNPLAFRTDLAIWTLVVFVVLFGLLSYFAWPQIAAALDERERKIAENIAAAEAQLADAKRVLADHEARLAAAAGEVRALLEEARRDAEHTKSSIIAEARKAAEGEKERAILEIDRAKDGALHELAVHAANTAIDLAKTVTARELSTERNNELIRDAMAKLPRRQPSTN